MTASEVYALSQGSKCVGDQECHWCGGPCTRVIQHDDPMTPIPARFNPLRAERPGNSYMCMGCWLWHRKRLTIHFLKDNSFKDGQSPETWSWLVLPEKAWVITPGCSEALWKFLIKPTHTFVLSLLDNSDVKTGFSNHVHRSVANDVAVIKADTTFEFTINNLRYDYTIYECQECMRINPETNRPNGPEGKSPGVRELYRLFGPPPFELPKHKKGRTSNNQEWKESIKRVVALSGQPEPV